MLNLRKYMMGIFNFHKFYLGAEYNGQVVKK